MCSGSIRTSDEGARECAGIGVIQRYGDVGHRHRRVLQQLLGEIEAQAVEQLLEAHAVRAQPPMERPPRDRKAAGNGLARRFSRQQHGANKSAQPGRQFGTIGGFKLGDPTLENPAHRRIGARNPMVEPAGGKKQRRAFRAETHSRTKQTSVRRNVPRPLVHELDFVRHPRLAAQIAHQAHADRQGSIRDLFQTSIAA